MKKIATQRGHPPMSVGWLVTMTVSAFYLYEYYLRVIPSTMMPYFIAQFGASVGEIGHIETAYYWTYVPLQIFVGTILDIFGVRKPLFLALASCTLGCVLFSFDSSMNWLIIGRALMGFGSAFGFVAVLKAATVWLPKKHFPLAIGIATAMGSLGAIFGKVITTKIITDYGFISLFDIITQSSIALIIISYFLVYDKQKLSKKSNFRRKFSALAQTIITVIRTPKIWIIGLIGMFLYTPTQILGFWDIQFLASSRGFSPAMAAQASSMIYWGWLIGSPCIGYLSTFVKRKSNIFLVGVVGLSYSLYALIYTPIDSLATLSIVMFIIGLFSSTQIIVFDLTTQVCHPSHSGTAIAITNMFVMFSSFLQKLVSYLIELNMENGIITLPAFQTGFMIMFIGLAITVILSFFTQAERELID